MKKTGFCLILIFGLSIGAFCGQISRVELNDGSVIEGDILSLNNGIYTLHSASLGEIKVETEKIRRIDTKSQETAPADNPPLNIDPNLVKSEINKVHRQIANDPEIIQKVNNLADDAEFQEAMKDPELIKAAKSQDIAALMSNGKFMNLIKNPKVKEIENKLQETK